MSNNHSVFLLHYHLVLVIKYRHKVIDEVICNRLKEIFLYIAPNYNITVQEWDCGEDHLHILFKAHPNSELSKFINAYKSTSSRLVKKEFPIVREKLWKESFWSRSFCLVTTGGAPLEIVRRYIENQAHPGASVLEPQSPRVERTPALRVHSCIRIYCYSLKL